MKDFVKMTLAVICGILLSSIICLFLTMGFFGSLAAAGSSAKPVLPREGILKMDLSKIAIVEQETAQTDPMALLQGSEITPVGIWNAVQALDIAAADPAVKCLYMKVDGAGTDLAGAEELRAALLRFRESGKAVIAYTESPTTKDYYLATAADKIIMSSASGAGPMITGIGSQMFFLKDILDKLGVNVQLIRHGKYKSAGEMFIRSTPSPENLEQNQEMINSLWNTLSAAIEESRGLPQGRMSELIDNLRLNNAQDMMQNGLVDQLLSKEELRQLLTVQAGKEQFTDVQFIPFADYASAKVLPNLKAKEKIAILYASGDITEENKPGQIGGDAYAALIAQIRRDKDIKAVVFRVSSPGGSVLASDKIKQEIELLRKEKPVIASYGSYAASGGYWISNSCDKIFSDRTTLTGSIGVFSMIPDLSKTAKDILHVGIATVGSSKHSDMMSMMRPLDTDEKAYMQASVEEIYSRFVQTVAEGREMEPDFVDSIAQGRVWSGADGLKLGLVDAIGTLSDAVNYATIAAAGSETGKTFDIVTYPEPLTTLQTLMLMLDKSGQDTDVLAGTPFSGIEQAFRSWEFGRNDRFYARMPYAYVIE